ncbi:CheR family methyltransferase [Pseudomonadota bacterium]
MSQGGAPSRLVFPPEDYEAFKKLLQEVSGIELGPGKEYLVSSRLSGIMRQHGLSSLNELMQALGSGHQMRLRNSVIDAMTTNETFWFRDMAHYRLLAEKIFPEAPNGRPLRIWSAACSSGQEPYSISMHIQDYKARNPGRLPGGVEIVATDISPTMLEEARRGVYSSMVTARGLDDEQRRRFFQPHADGLEVRPEIRQRVRFQEFNLTRGFEILGRFDVIFCRNVLIYFSGSLKQDIINRMAKALHPSGHLFLGSTESLSSHSSSFQMVSAHGGIVYRLKQ